MTIGKCEVYVSFLLFYSKHQIKQVINLSFRYSSNQLLYRRVSGKGNATENPYPYEGPLSADVPTANVYELPVKIQTESSLYDELSLEVYISEE